MGDVLVLCYHALSEQWPAALAVSPTQFRAQIHEVLRRGYEPVTFTQAITESEVNRRLVAITFDDAYRSVLSLARPILDGAGAMATVFVPTDWAGQRGPMRWPGIDQWVGGPHEAELQSLDWDELGALAAGGWEVGSHTCSHPRLTELDDSRLGQELTASRALIETALGGPCTSLAYPYGDTDGRVIAAAAAAGYTAAGMLPRRLTGLGDLGWPRVGIYRGDTGGRFRLKISPVGRRIRCLPGIPIPGGHAPSA